MLFWRFLLLLVYVPSSPYDNIFVWGTSDNIQSIIFMSILEKKYVHGKRTFMLMAGRFPKGDM